MNAGLVWLFVEFLNIQSQWYIIANVDCLDSSKYHTWIKWCGLKGVFYANADANGLVCKNFLILTLLVKIIMLSAYRLGNKPWLGGWTTVLFTISIVRHWNNHNAQRLILIIILIHYSFKTVTDHDLPLLSSF